MKFAFISTMQGSPWGASEELWSQTASRLKLAGHEVRATVPDRRQLSEKLAVLAQQGITLQTHPSPSYLTGPARYYWNRLSLGTRRSFDRLKRFNPDLVVISQGFNSGGFDWAKVCVDAAIPYVMIVHLNRESWWFDDREIGKAVASYTAARKVFCVSRQNLDLLRLQLGEPLKNGDVVWNPYPVSSQPIPDWPDDDKVLRLACVARLDPAHKGQDLLLQILARPEWRERSIELNFYGEGSYEQALRRLSAMLELKNVHFRGHVKDVRAIWEHNHLLVQPSRYEGVPLTVIEAMWCGRPAVVTDFGRAAELCLDNETGFVAPEATLSSFGHALDRAWQRRGELRQLGRAARARAETLVPKNPIELFSEQLEACAAANR